MKKSLSMLRYNVNYRLHSEGPGWRKSISVELWAERHGLGDIPAIVAQACSVDADEIVVLSMDCTGIYYADGSRG